MMKNKRIGEMEVALGQERKGKVEFIRLLVRADKSQWYLEAGFSSLFVLCTKELGLSRSSALKRIGAARVASRFPVVLELLETGKIHLTHVGLLSPHLTLENHEALFLAASQLSERKLEKWLSSQFPEEVKGPKEKLKWLDGEKAQLTLIVDSELLALLERAKELMKHSHPTGETVPLLKDILKKLLKSIDPLQRKTRAARKKNPRTEGRCIPRGVQARVWKRDEGRCTYVSPEGKRCEETAGLELDHAQPWASGGRSDDQRNIALLCFSHNRWLAKKTFGKRCPSKPLPEM
jgi:hypothetical protein